MSAAGGDPRGGIEALWRRDGLGARLLAPLGWLFGGVTAARNAAYDLGLIRAHALGLPSVSVGNLSVGGTGKTPVAAWIAQRLLAQGARPAILLRGYGDDEPLVHARLTPEALVIADVDRVRAARAARARGATVAVLDDAFQHRRAARDLDLVLVAAEQGAAHRVLPAGPLREWRRGLRRADAILVTRKRASLGEAESVARAWGRFAPEAPTVIIALAPGPLQRVVVSGSPDERPVDALPVDALRGRAVLAISAIGEPAAFEAQLTALGARLTSAAFADHHAFSPGDVARLAARAPRDGLVVCTLKDAVKLAAQWPRGGPALWYLSQAVSVERGAEWLEARLARLAGTPST